MVPSHRPPHSQPIAWNAHHTASCTWIMPGSTWVRSTNATPAGGETCVGVTNGFSTVWSFPVAVELRDPPLEETPLGVVVGQHQRPTVRVARLIGPAETAQQLAARGVQVPVVLQAEPVDDVEPRLGPLRLGNRDGPAQLDDL